MRRIAVYVYHDKNGTIADYAAFFVKSLLEVVDEIIFVINGSIEQAELKKIRHAKIRVIQRENTGYDFWAYRHGFLSIGVEKLKTFDELIFANSSVFGPVFSLREMFKTMRLKDVDFWGVTKHPELNQNVIRFKSSTKIKEHLQSYFLVFRKKIFNSNEFREYFENLLKIKNKKEAIGHLEVNLTDYFEKLGYKYDAYVDDSILDYGVANYLQYLPDVAVEKYKCPFVKKTIFGERFDLAQRETNGNKSLKLFNYLLKNTDYDTRLIVKEISKEYPLNQIKNFLGLNFILNETEKRGEKTAFLYDPSRTFDFLDSYMEEINERYDVYKLSKLGIFETLKMLFEKYNEVLVFAPEQNMYMMKNQLRRDMVDHFINSIIRLNFESVFENNPYIGVLTPPPFIYEKFQITKKTIDKKDLKSFLNYNGFSIKTEINFLGTIPPVFAIRKEVFDEIDKDIFIKNDSTINTGVAFSLIAQNYGFLTGTISTPEIMTEIFNKLQFVELKRVKLLKDAAYKVGKIIRGKN